MLKIKEIKDAPKDWDYYKKRPVIVKATQIMEEFEVETLEGTMTGKPGDFLIKGIKGELYPCDKQIFIETYEKENKGDFL